MAHKNPQKPEETQRSLDIGLARPREAQRGPERPRKAPQTVPNPPKIDPKGLLDQCFIKVRF